jgi:magnesium-dependent phosphatase 1
MALASRTHSPEIAGKLLELFGIGDYFSYHQIYPGSKVRHFNYLQKKSSVPFENMYFFDDEHRNIMEVERLGVQSKLVSGGLSWRDIHGFPDLRHVS